MRTTVFLLFSAIVATSGCGSRAGASVPAAAGHDIQLARETVTIAATVSRGATLASVLAAQHVANSDAADLIAEIGSVFDVRQVRADQPYRLVRTLDGAVRRFEYEIDTDRVLRVVRSAESGSLRARILPIPKTRRTVVVHGRIDRDASSLVAALAAEGETVDLALGLADVLGGEIDFSADPQPGDEFELTVEKQYRDGGEFAGYGPILAAEFDNAGRRVRAVRFTPEGGSPGYYDEHGVSMRRFFLASPLKFQPVITSAFSRHRFHPILRTYRAHLGVDYRAPIGAPVIAVAAGVVVFAGASGGSGRMVHLRHAEGFETEYLHLSSIGVRSGERVEQGQVIGRVGMTGLATGPHLDYRVIRNHEYVNPVAAHRAMPPAPPIPADQMAAFEATRDRALASLSGTALASDAGPADADGADQQ